MFVNALQKVVEQYPSTTAIVQGDDAISYAELWDRARLIGGYLKEQGVGAEDVVGLYFHKSIAYLEALLGTWIAGAAFVPIDPSLPEERQSFMTQDAGVNIVLSPESEYGDKSLTEPVQGQVHDLAYLIYTSGSTGTPKGVMVEHVGLLNILNAQIEKFEYFAGAQALFYLSHSFDASISDIGTALLSGSTLHIEPVCKLQNIEEFYDIVSSKQITHIDLPPSFLKLLDPQRVSKSLKSVVIGGEVPDAETVKLWSQRVNLVNVYGPTEATICTSMVRCTPDWTVPDIGAVVPGMAYHVFDENGEPAREGELYISGVQLARGYQNREDLTAEKFPIIEGKRYYRTGDKVECLEDGRTIFHGRIDRQVKIRGQLVELEEVEQALMSCPQVKRCAVVKRGVSKTALREQLVGFVQSSGADLSIDELRESLRQKLPKWMVPYRFEVMKELPHTVTGKVDSKQLEKVPLVLSDRDTLQTEAERKLASVWKDVLGVESLSSTDHFFEVGGDSLAALDLSIQAGKVGWHISPTLVAAKPVLKDMAEALENQNDMLHTGGMPASLLEGKVSSILEDILPLNMQPVSSIQKHVLLTGATGFLGARMLWELLNGTEVQVYTLVRAKDTEAALQRIQAALQVQNLKLTEAQWQRVVPVCGDITQEHLGLNENVWGDLTSKVDTVYHCAAHVNTVLPYEALEASNVLGVQHIVEFCVRGQSKHLHYASTLSVFVATDQNTGTVYESDDLSSTKVVYGGYAQTKWVSDRLLCLLKKAGMPVSIYRFGLITGDRNHGVSAKSDFINMFFAGMRSLAVYPEGVQDQMYIDITPCDYASKAFFKLALNQLAGTYHVANKQGASLNQLLSALKTHGVTLSALSQEDWGAKVSSLIEMSPEESASYLALCRADETLFKNYRTMDLFQATGISFDTAEASTLLAHEEGCPEVTPDLLETYAKFALFGKVAS